MKKFRKSLSILLILCMIAAFSPFALADVIDPADDPSMQEGAELSEPAGDPETDSFDSPGTGSDAEEQPEATIHERTLADGTYVFATALDTTKVINPNATVAGANIVSTTYSSSLPQAYTITYDESTGFYDVVNEKTGLGLNIISGKARAGTNVRQWPVSGTAEKWVISESGTEGYYTIASALDSSMMLTVATKSNNANINIELANGSASQRFLPVSTKQPPVAESTAQIADGYYQISLRDKNSLRVNTSGSSNGTGITLANASTAYSQLFRFEKIGGFYCITSASCGKSIDLDAGAIVPGARVQTWATSTASANQLWSAIDNGDGSVTFINKAGHTAMAFSGTAASGRALTGQLPISGAASQSFALTAVKQLVTPGLYDIRPTAAYDKKTLSSSSNIGKLASITGDFVQKWSVRLAPGEENAYIIQNVSTARYLASGGANSRTTLLDSASSSAAVWDAQIVNGSVVFVNRATGKALTLAGAHTNSGTDTVLATNTGAAHQRWTLIAASPANNGMYVIRSRANSSRVVTVKGGSSANSANIVGQSFSSDTSAAQKFNFKRNSDGTYTITNAANGKALDVAGGKAASGTNVQQYKSNGCTAQRWNLVYCNNGSFCIVSALDSSLCLEMERGNTASGTNLRVATYTGASTQRWTFEKTSYTPYSGAQLSMYSRAQGLTSYSRYLILVDYDNCRVGIFSGSKGNWKFVKYIPCTPGAYGSPTVHGTFSISGHVYHFGEEKGYTCWYASQFYGNYLFHSVLYYPNSFSVMDGTLGQHLSHGCVRLALGEAKWIYDNIPLGTKVVVY